MIDQARISKFLHELSELTKKHKIYIDSWMHGVEDYSLASLYDKDGLIATNLQFGENGEYTVDLNEKKHEGVGSNDRKSGSVVHD